MPTVRALFSRHGLRCTRQRESIFSALKSTNRHPTPEQLHSLVGEHDPSISLATVYNTLDALCDAGLCRRFASETGSTAYRYDADVESHAHLETTDGRLLDLPEALGEELLDAIPDELLRRIEHVMAVDIERVSLRLIAKGDRGNG